MLMTIKGVLIGNLINWALVIVTNNNNNNNATTDLHTQQITIAHAVSVR
jgi:hypothetical protein